MADLPECPNCSQNADVVELVYTHGLGPCATSMWVRVPPSAQKFRKRVALQAGAPALERVWKLSFVAKLQNFERET